MKKLFLLLLFASISARAATYQVALPGGGTLVINGLPYLNPQITNSASVVWTTNADGLLTLAATAVGTNASIVFVEGAAVSSPNFGVSTEIDPAVVTTNVTFSIVNSSITTNKIDPTFYSLLMQAGAGDVTQAGNNTFTGTNIFGNQTTISNLAITTANVGSMTLSTPIGVTAVGTNAADARGALGVAYDIDVQAYRLGLLQAALALTADGHMLVHNGSLVTNLTSTAAGRALLTAASASAQWNSYLLAVASTNGGYDSTSWNGITDRLVTLDQFRDAINALPGGSNAITSVTSPLHLTNGVLSLDTSGLGGGGGGGGVTWLTNVSLGSWQGRDAGTNWNVMTFTVSSNDVPSTVGQYLNGEVSCVISNASGGTAAIVFVTSLNGSTIFKDTYTLNNMASIIPGRLAVNRFHLIRETTGTLSIVGLGAHSANADPGLGDTSASLTAWTLGATNVTYAGGDVTLTFEIQSESTNTSPASLGIRRVAASLMKYSAETGSGTGNVTGPASSTNNAIVLFSGTGGTNIIDSGVLLSDLQTHDTDLDDLADGSLSGSKIGSGINADNVTTGTIASNRLPADISLTTLSAGTLTATSVSGNGSGLTNLQTSVTNPVNNEVVSATVLNNAIANIAGGVVYGSTNASGINTNYLSFSDTVPADWSQTYSSIASGETLVGGRQITNQQTRIAKGQYVHTVFIAATGIGGPTLTYRSDLYKITATNETLLDTGSSVPLTLSVTNECRTISYLPTNVPLAAGEYLAVKRYVKRSGGASANVTIHGGTATPTRLETPALSLSSDYVSKSGDTMTGALTNTVRIGAPALFAGTTNVADALALKAPLASPALTGTPTINSTNVMAEVNGKQGLLSNSDGLAAALSDETGTGSAVLGTAPTIDSPQLTGNSVHTLQSWSAYSGTNYVVDAAVRLLTLTMSTNIAVLHATNRPGSSTTYKETQLRILGGSTNWNVVWPTGWRRLGSNITQIPSNKLVWVAIATFTNETDTTFGIAKEE